MKISIIQQIPKYSELYRNERYPDIHALRTKADESINECLEMISQAADDGADLAVTIETVNAFLALGDTRYNYPDVYGGVNGNDVQMFSNAAKKHKIYIVAGLLVTIEQKTYNCAVLFDKNGDIAGIHKKVHLPAGEELTVAPGDKFEVFDTDFGRIGMLVCWDMQYPEAARELALAGADLIACPTLGWENIYGLSRAYENSVTIAAAMATWRGGLSDIVDPSCIVNNMGKIVAVAPRDRECVITAEIDINQEPLPQYSSQKFYPSNSMRKTRFVQRRPDTYRLASMPLDQTPLYKRYFKN